MTLFADHPTILFALLSVPTGLLLYSPMPKSGTPLPLRQPPVSSTSTSSNQVRIPALPALTTYRAHMMLMTVLSILAVDFPVFPRNLVKCETFGVSLVWTVISVFLSFNIWKILDGPWCRIFCVFAGRCICYTNYQKPHLSNFPSRVQVYTCDSQITPNHCPRSYPRYSRERNWLSGNLSLFLFYLLFFSNLLNLCV